MATATHIKNTAQGIHAIAPRLTTGAYLGSTLRDQLEELAELCGLPFEVSREASDNDLISIYLVSLKDGAGGQRVANKVRLRLDAPKGFFDDVPASGETKSRPPMPRPDPKDPVYGDKEAPSAPAGPSADAIRAMIKQEVREGAVEPLQTALETIHDELSDAIARVPSDAAEAALGAMRAEMGTMAHKAALEALATLAPTRLEIVRGDDAPPIQLGIVHKKTAQILAALQAGVHVYLHGPAGSGKTTVARKCADAFGSGFHMAAKVESEYLLLGFKDARGETVRTPFREAYEHGGLFLFDELDRSAPSAVTAMNAALANGICPFPDALVSMHPEFRCIAAGNTKMTGASRQYIAASQMDASVIDRFAFIEFGYDDDLELALASDQTWAKYVQRVRQVVAERGLSHLVTPRATIEGCKLLAAGFDRTTVASMVIYKGLDADTVTQIEAAL